MILDTSLAFFDVDSLEYRPQQAERASVLPGFAYRERMLPIAAQLDALHAYAAAKRHPLAFSVCCSGRAPRPGDPAEVVHVAALDAGAPLPPPDAGRLYYVEKAATPNTRGSGFVERMHDKFRGSANLARFVRHLDAREWVVFGNGAAFCVHPVLCCLLDAGQQVTILADVLIDRASGYTAETPADLRLAMLDACARRGANVCSHADFARRLDAGGLPPRSPVLAA